MSISGKHFEVLSRDLTGKGQQYQEGDSAQFRKEVSSDYSRRRIVEDGVVKDGFSSFNVSETNPHLWAFSSVKLRHGTMRKVSVCTFEKGCNLDRIEERAFESISLRSIVIPSSVVVLGKSCFSYCGVLETVIFESDSKLERIEESAFRSSGLRSIEIPPRATFIDGSAFLVYWLDYFSVSRDNETFRFRELFLERSDGSAICRYFGSCRSVLIPSSVVVLGQSSFSECRSLASVLFENGSRLERIEKFAFRESGLKSILIPSSVVVLGQSSFSECKSLGSVLFEKDSRLERIEESAFRESGLRSIVIPSSVVLLGKEGFYQCKFLWTASFESGSRLGRIEESTFGGTRLSFVGIPSSVVVFGKKSFFWCQSLESVAFEDSSRLERIEDSAFAESGLRSIVIPARVNFIDGSAFDGVHLDSISISPGNETFRLRDNCLESIDGSSIYRCFGCPFSRLTSPRGSRSWNSVVIPSSVVALCRSSFRECQLFASVTFESGSLIERIEEYAFCWSQVDSIVIPSSVVVLGKASFYGCKPLESIVFESDSRLERIEESVFQRSGLSSIVIPSSVVVLGKASFSQCDRLHSVSFESGSRLERIEESAFEASALRSIVVPSSVVVWGKRVFAECSSDISAQFDNGFSLKEMDGSLFVRAPWEWSWLV